MMNDQWKFVVGIALVLLIPTSVVGEGKIYTGQVRGQQVEQIDGVDHVVERYVGRPDGHSAEYQLNQLGVTLAPEDRVEAFPDAQFGLGSALRVTRATEVTIVDVGESTLYRTWVTTVEDLLRERSIELGNDDTVSINKSSTIENKMTITITRVEVTEIHETEPIAYQTTTVDDPEMEKGQTKILKRGKDGLRTKTYRVRRENGKQVEKTLLKKETTTEPIAEKIARGTKVIGYGSGQATWYALKSGLGAAHNTLPKGTRVKVTNLANGKSVDVVINDHGIQGNAIIDLTREAFEKIASLGAGRIPVRLEKDYD